MVTYHLVGRVPVRTERRADGTTVTEALDLHTGQFERSTRHRGLIHRDDTGLVRELTEEEFTAEVTRVRTRRGEPLEGT